MGRTIWWWGLGLALLCDGASSGWAADGPLTDDEVVVRTEGAHRLLLPKDWPVEHRDGRFSPIPLEEYLSMKFDQVAEAFEATNRRLDALQRRFERLEDTQKALETRLRDFEARSEDKRR